MYFFFMKLFMLFHTWYIIFIVIFLMVSEYSTEIPKFTQPAPSLDMLAVSIFLLPQMMLS